MRRVERALRTWIPLLALGVASCATRAPQIQAEYFDLIDANGNDQITIEEFSKVISSTAFGEMDMDADGAVDAEEWGRAEKDGTAAQRFSETDTNKDGVLSYEEFTGLKRKKTTIRNLFSTFDRDGDGVLRRRDLGSKPSN